MVLVFGKHAQGLIDPEILQSGWLIYSIKLCWWMVCGWLSSNGTPSPIVHKESSEGGRLDPHSPLPVGQEWRRVRTNYFIELLTDSKSLFV